MNKLLKKYLTPIISGVMAINLLAINVSATNIADNSYTYDTSESEKEFNSHADYINQAIEDYVSDKEEQKEEEEKTIHYNISELKPENLVLFKVDDKIYFSLKHSKETIATLKETTDKVGLQINKINNSESYNESWDTSINNYSPILKNNETTISIAPYCSEFNTSLQEGDIFSARYVTYDDAGNILETSLWSDFCDYSIETLIDLKDTNKQTPIVVEKASISLDNTNRYLLSIKLAPSNELSPYLQLPNGITSVSFSASFDNGKNYAPVGSAPYNSEDLIVLDVSDKIEQFSIEKAPGNIPIAISAKFEVNSSLGEFSFSDFSQEYTFNDLVEVTTVETERPYELEPPVKEETSGLNIISVIVIILAFIIFVTIVIIATIASGSKKSSNKKNKNKR